MSDPGEVDVKRAVPPGAGTRVAATVMAVVRRALADAGAGAIRVQHADTPAGRLLLGWLADASVDADPATADDGAVARLLLAHPADKTCLLLGGAPPDAALLPLGDLWGSQVQALADGWDAPEPVRALAEQSGGIAALDAALSRWIDERADAAESLAALPAGAGAAVLEAFEAGRLHRRRAGLVPKLGGRTVGIDLFD
jgi:hypothetical protein